MHHYFAYCTLLDIEGMRKYCPTAKSLGIMRLPGYRLGFAAHSPNLSGGGCTLQKVPVEEMYGVLYEVTDEEFKRLEAASEVEEGHWANLDVVLINEQGENVSAKTYFIPNPFSPFHPLPSYTRTILIGARAFGLPQEYIAKLETIIESARGSA